MPYDLLIQQRESDHLVELPSNLDLGLSYPSSRSLPSSPPPDLVGFSFGITSPCPSSYHAETSRCPHELLTTCPAPSSPSPSGPSIPVASGSRHPTACTPALPHRHSLRPRRPRAKSHSQHHLPIVPPNIEPTRVQHRKLKGKSRIAVTKTSLAGGEGSSSTVKGSTKGTSSRVLRPRPVVQALPLPPSSSFTPSSTSSVVTRSSHPSLPSLQLEKDCLRLSDTADEMTSFFTSSTNYLSAKVEIKFDNEAVVDMLGNPNTGTSYSLPGHVLLTVPTLPAGVEGRVRVVKELRLLMEGKSEYFDDAGRYVPFRLHSSMIDLAASGEQLLLPSSDLARPTSSRLQLAVSFDMRLPGWLPPSHVSANVSIAFGAEAHVVIGWVEGCSAPAPSRAPLIGGHPLTRSMAQHLQSPSRFAASPSKTKALFSNSSLQLATSCKSASKYTPFTVRRHHIPSAVRGHAFVSGERHYTIKPTESTCPVECVVSVPEWVDVNGDERALKVSLRVRARQRPTDGEQMEVDTADQKDDVVLTHLLELGMEVEEVERAVSEPAQQYLATFPVPLDQPSIHSSEFPLLGPRNVYADTVSFEACERLHRVCRQRPCLLADDGTQRNFLFAKDGLGLCGDKWRKVNVVLPMPLETGKGSNRPQAVLDGPFIRIRHSLKIKLVCKNVGTESDTMVLLSTPIRFGTCQDTIPTASADRLPQLPPYIQLFHENGELRECDPLPLYCAPEASSASLPQSIPTSPAPAYSSIVPAVPNLLPEALKEPFMKSAPSTRSPSPARSSPPPPFEGEGAVESDRLAVPPCAGFAEALGARMADAVVRPPSRLDEPMDVDTYRLRYSGFSGSEGSDVEAGSSDLERESRRRSLAPPPVSPRTPVGRKVRQRVRVAA